MSFPTADEEVLELQTILEILNTILNSTVFKLFYISFPFHISFLIYCIFYKWNITFFRDLRWYIPRIRRYTGLLIGLFSGILSLQSVDVAEKNFRMSYVLISLSFYLSIIAALVAYGTNGQPNVVVGIVIIILASGICLPILKAFEMLGISRASLIRHFVGVYYLHIGMLLTGMGLRR